MVIGEFVSSRLAVKAWVTIVVLGVAFGYGSSPIGESPRESTIGRRITSLGGGGSGGLQPEDVFAQESPFSVSSVSNGLKVGIFYTTYNGVYSPEISGKAPHDVTLADQLSAYFRIGRAFQSANGEYWWDQPAFGFYQFFQGISLSPERRPLADNRQVRLLREHARMIRRAGVDFAIIDVTNHIWFDQHAPAVPMVLKPLENLLAVWNTLPDPPKVVVWAKVDVPHARANDSRILTGECAGTCATEPFTPIVALLRSFPRLQLLDQGKPLLLVTDGHAQQDPALRQLHEVQVAALRRDFTVEPMWANYVDYNPTSGQGVPLALPGPRMAVEHWSYNEVCANPSEFKRLNGERECGQRFAVSRQDLPRQISVSAGVSGYLFSETDRHNVIPRYRGKTLLRQMETAFQKRRHLDYLLVSWFNEWIIARVCPPGSDRDWRDSGAFRCRNAQGQEVPALGANGLPLFTDAFDPEFSRDIEPSRVLGDYYLRLLRKGLEAFRNERNPITAFDPEGLKMQGAVDSVQVSGNELVITGWACQKGTSQSVGVRVQFGEIVVEGNADRPAEAAVRQLCDSSRSAHRFSLSIPMAAIDPNWIGKAVRVTALSPFEEYFPSVDIDQNGQKVPAFAVSNAGRPDRAVWLRNNPCIHAVSSEEYRNLYSDVRAAKMSAWEHYMVYGKAEGRCPVVDPRFHASDYLAANPDVMRGSIEPSVRFKNVPAAGARNHFCRQVIYGGEARELVPGGPRFRFSPTEYLLAHPDLAKNGVRTAEEARQHFCVHGVFEGRALRPAVARPEPGGMTCTAEEYLQRYSDIQRSGMNPFVHYLRYGWKEGRCQVQGSCRHPVTASEYLAIYPDLQAAGYTPLQAASHFQRSGRQEGRCLIDNHFVASLYLEANPDVANWLGGTRMAPEERARQHFCTFVIQGQERRALVRGGRAFQFDPQAYLDANPDIAQSGTDPRSHACRYGLAEERVLSP